MVSKAPYGRADTMGKLFAATVTSARPRERGYKLTDGAGLYLLVKPNGRTLWRLNYAYLGKQRTLSLGAWPDVGLADARERRDEVRKQEREGMAEITLSKIRWLLDKAYPRIGSRPVAKISRRKCWPCSARSSTARYESARRNNPSRYWRGTLTAPRAKHLAAIATPKRGQINARHRG